MSIAKYLQRFSVKEKIWLGVSVSFFVIAVSIFAGDALFQITTTKPAPGGTYKEGVLGQPRFINPVLAPLNSTDRSLSKLIYPSLFKLDTNGELDPYLAKNITSSEDLKTFEVKLKENATWQDGEPITAQDVVFTITTLQEPGFNSPLRETWQEIEVEATGEHSVRFRLPEPYTFFKENLTLGILPQHKWKNVSADRFSLNSLNIKPLSGGPYSVTNVNKNDDGSIRTLRMKKTEDFWGETPYINQLTFRFYPNTSALINALRSGQVDGMSSLPVQFYPDIKNDPRLRVHATNQLLYYALFFNQNQKTAFENKKVRRALGLAINRQKLIEQVWHNQASVVNSPLPPQATYAIAGESLGFNPEKAKTLLKEDDAQNMEIELTVSTVPALESTAQFIKKAWENVGLEVRINPVASGNMESEVLQGREYEVLLFGQALRANADPFSFWHSSQTGHPGLNLAGYTSNEVDEILETIRQTKEEKTLKEKFTNFQQQVGKDLPAVFLFSPKMLYAMNKKVKGVDIKTVSQPSDRFWNIQNWYINTQRIYSQ